MSRVGCRAGPSGGINAQRHIGLCSDLEPFLTVGKATFVLLGLFNPVYQPDCSSNP